MTRASHQIDGPAAHASRSMAESDPPVRAALGDEIGYLAAIKVTAARQTS